ncbi:Sodium- and chloride-dependent glycine transporter 2 [Bulinus truncatus]|nr:Sodium- and chloride-dependent glycine transporter 2 [Bulinus truncatus]
MLIIKSRPYYIDSDTIHYRLSRFIQDLETMIGRKCCLYNHCLRPCHLWWKVCWGLVTPALILFVIIFSALDQSSTKQKYPLWIYCIGWVMISSAIIWIGLTGIYVIITQPGTMTKKFHSAFVPTMWWGPALTEHRLKVAEYVDGFIVFPDSLDPHFQLNGEIDQTNMLTFSAERIDSPHKLQDSDKTIHK